MTAFKQQRRAKIVVQAVKTGQIWREVGPRDISTRIIIVDDLDGEGSSVTVATMQTNGTRSTYVRWMLRKHFTGKRGGYALVSEPQS